MTIDLLAIGTSSLRAYKASLEVVGGNVANAESDGYVRRRTDLTAGPILAGGSLRYIGVAGGSGVRIGGVGRNYDIFLAQQARDTRSASARDAAASVWLAEIERALGTQSDGVANALGRFFNAGDELAASPTSIAARTLFVSETANTADRFREAAQSLSGLKLDTAAEAAAAASQATAALDVLALVNERLRQAGPGSAAAASLLDEQGRQLQAVAEFVPIHVGRLANGEVEVRLQDEYGDVLLAGSRVAALAVRMTAGMPRLLVDANFAPRDIAVPASGKIAALVDAFGRADAALGDLDALADRFADRMNAAHMAGSDLAGDRGGSLFGNVAVAIEPGPGTGNGAVVKPSVAGSLFPGGYMLAYDAASADWTLSRADGSAAVTGAGVLALDGLSVELGGSPSAGDRYVLNPVSGAGALRALIVNPAKVAAAAAFQTENASPSLAGTQVVPDAAAALPASARHRYTWIDAATVEVTDAAGAVVATLPYLPGDTLEGAGFRLLITGTPAAGDSIDVFATPANYSDNRNVAALVALGGSGGEAFEDRFAAQRTAASTALSQARRRGDISAIAAEDAGRAETNAAGVNLDEEAADLIRFQQAYEASTRIIAAARDMFDSLLAMS